MSMSPEEVAYEKGWKAYLQNVTDSPYDPETQPILWSIWCDGHNDAYCAEECK